MRAFKTLTAVAALATALAVSTASHAAITVSNSAYETYAQDVANFAETNIFCNFDTPCTGGWSFTFTGGTPAAGVYGPGSIPNVGAAPPGDTTQYANVTGPDGKATLTLPVSNLLGISFFMGSPDSYNTITFFNGASQVGQFTGLQFTGPPANGDQSLGERISFQFNGQAVTSVQFTSTTNSFEFDRVGLAVPEPATWAMMIVGIGGLGAVLRGRRRQQLALA